MNKDFLDQWIQIDKKAEVTFVSAPITFPPVPSIALSIFQAVLDEAGISSQILYTMFPTVHLLGTDFIYELSRYMDFQNYGEYFFAFFTDIHAAADPEAFVKKIACHLPEEKQKKIHAMVDRVIEIAKQIIEAAAQRVIRSGSRVVAASSVFAQQNASLAILRRVKELDPTIRTLFGGSNASGEMGLTILRNYPSVDYISFGEGDEIMADVCAILLGKKSGPMPYGVLGREDLPVTDAPYRLTKDMNQIPTPSYRDFFEEIRREEEGFYGDMPQYYAETFENVIFLEGSRGCWWGAKHPCSFCGLNGLTNVYREKTPERLYEEIRQVTLQYPGAHIQLSDNVLSQNMIDRLLPVLAEDPEKYQILAEVKTNLKWPEVQMLAKAGVMITQPGIESLNDHLLKLMGKGSTQMQNIALLKYCRSCGIYPVWNMMTGVPGEEREDYEEMAELIPLITHLNPPTRTNNIAFNRFSRYTDHPEQYGLKLQPDSIYAYYYGDHEDLIQNMGIYYDLIGGEFLDTYRANQDVYWKIAKAVKYWRDQYYSPSAPLLHMTENLLGIFIRDTRECAVENQHILMGLSAKIYRMAWKPVTIAKICKELPDVPEETIRNILDRLAARKIMLHHKEQYLALATQRQAQTCAGNK